MLVKYNTVKTGKSKKLTKRHNSHTHIISYRVLYLPFSLCKFTFTNRYNIVKQSLFENF